MTTTNNTLIRKTFTTVLALGLLATTPALATEEEKPTADLTVSALSQYIFRGFEMGKDSLVIQPSMTVGYKGFSANLWANLDTKRANVNDNETSVWQETDMTLSYSYAFDKLGVTGGYIYYGLGAMGLPDTKEFFVSVSYDTLLSPSLTVYRDVGNLAGWYISAAIGHSLPITSDISLDLGAKVNYLKADEASSFSEGDLGVDAYSSFHDGVISAAITFPVNSFITITPQVAYSFPLGSKASDLIEAWSISGDDSDFIYGGVAASLAF
ncbi:MAG: hypothetical protein KJ621_05060 [Proteobacteria bacterium]|nr:hypothetical protein [Pseudomonadota bacterium]